MKRKTKSFRCSEADAAAVARVAQSAGIDESTVIRIALRKYFAKLGAKGLVPQADLVEDYLAEMPDFKGIKRRKRSSRPDD